MSLRPQLIKLASTLPAGSQERTALLDVLAALPDGTVKTFLAVASSKLTQYDERLQKRQPNIYRLGHYFGALEKVEADVSRHKNDDSPEALEALRQSLLRRFTSRGGKSDLPPIRNVIKQIDAFLESGKLPSLRG